MQKIKGSDVNGHVVTEDGGLARDYDHVYKVKCNDGFVVFVKRRNAEQFEHCHNKIKGIGGWS